MNHEGIGLGLMVSKALVEKNGGKLDIFSKGIDKGSIFTFSMKMNQVELQHSESSQLSEFFEARDNKAL